MGTELEAVLAIIDPRTAALQVLTGVDAGGVTNDGHQIAVPAGFDPQDAEPTLFAVEGNPLDAAVHLLGRAADHRRISETYHRDLCLLSLSPIVSAESLRLAGFEALIRRRHPERGVVSPSNFVEVAERSGLIVPIGLWTLQQACAALPDLEAGAAEEPLFMSVNLSARQVAAPELVASVAQAIEASGIDPARLKLEITESVLMANPETAISVLLELRSLGLAIAVDDFGTGYSSLSYLHRFPIDVLKIDRSFMANMLTDGHSLKIVRTISHLAKDLGLKVIAEGVERHEEAILIKDLGCDYLQGYLFLPPRASNELAPLLASLAISASSPS